MLLAVGAALLRQSWKVDIWDAVAELDLDTLEAEAKLPSPVPQIRQRQPRLTREQRAKLVADYKSGLSLGAVARTHGVHINTVQRHVTNTGLNVRLQKPGIPDDELMTAQALRDAGWSLQAIGDKYGCSHTAAGNALKRHTKGVS